MSNDVIRIKNAHQNNLKNLDMELPLGELIVVTGVSGSGKSSLAFDTVYAEGQRRYVETFSPYARQFLDRMDRPRVDRIEGIPPAIAIDQTNPVRTSRSTVGTMTELNDHIKLLFARASRLFCRGCGREVTRDTPQSIADQLIESHEGTRGIITFPIKVPHNFTTEEIKALLAQQGYTRIHSESPERLEVVQDRVRIGEERRDRLTESLESALEKGQGFIAIYPLDEERNPGPALNFSEDLHCPDCDIHYQDPLPNHFSFNSPLGACDSCRGFGRTMGVDYDLVIPDEHKSLVEGAIKPFQTGRAQKCQEDLMAAAARHGVPVDLPWNELSEEQRRWVIEGEGEWDGSGRWYGVQRFFDFLETKSYKMHIRVLLSKYRAYDSCATCGGARLKDPSLDYRVGSLEDADRALDPGRRFRQNSIGMLRETWERLPGLNIHDLMCLPLSKLMAFCQEIALPPDLGEASDLLMEEITARLSYLCEVGLGYLTLDRQSRTLSGGEVQRINLTTALGTSLVNTLFVLDEPSIGLHPRDIDRINGVLRRLRDSGNSLLVVEHDPQIMLAADRILDIGPGPGEKGGQITFFGTPPELVKSEHSLTADYLGGRKQVSPQQEADIPDDENDYIEVINATEHNLKGIDVRIPLNRLVCITGVSGSGKSTLINDTLYNALAKLKGSPKEPAGAHDTILGHEHVQEVVILDQSPIGKTSRSNPASYVGGLDAIRKLFAKTPLAKERGYTAGTFSFNSGNGRCPTCSGSGFEHVEMQFLSDVYLRCPDCNGSRYRGEVLEARIEDKSVADVLGMTVTEALTFFSGNTEVRRALEPLEAVGLSYLRLGQPVPTLSGGEAQRLKLAGYLAKAKGGKQRKGPILFLLDEPTTGLHFDDIATLLQAFHRLLVRGHSLLVIEHNLDVIRAADWIIDLGPEGGDGGGEIICEGTPMEVTIHSLSHTGKALREYAESMAAIKQSVDTLPSGRSIAKASNTIEIRHAREHNLRNINIEIPRNKFTVITGVSGSGKSTIAFDILFNEGQRRYLESLNAYARQFVQPASRPDVDAIFGIPPTVAIEQRISRGGHKSTVATMTEIYHFLRLLFVKLGIQYCPDCQVPIQPQSREEIFAHVLRSYRNQRIAVMAPLIVHRKGIYNDQAKWADRKGYAFLRVDGEPAPTHDWPALDRYREHNIDLPIGEIDVSPRTEDELQALLDSALNHGKGVVRIISLDTETPSGSGEGWSGEERSYSTQRTCPDCGTGFEEPDPRLFSYNSKHGWCPDCYGTGAVLVDFDPEQSGEEDQWLTVEEETEVCPTCEGTRLRPEALAIFFQDWSITDYAACSVDEAAEVFNQLQLSGRELAIGRDLLSEIRNRLDFLREVGLGYLTLERAAPTLSGGEAQRIRLAAQLGSNLQGVCYILDEPTIGLHPRDNRMLLDTLGKLEGKGNTVVVVEHDEETIRRAEHLVDIGPSAGVQGGRVVAEGSIDNLMENPESLTGKFLAEPLQHPLMPRRPVKAEHYLEVKKAQLNNLDNLDIRIPLNRLVCVTGVSGSGKSTLIREVLASNLKHLLEQKRTKGKKGKARLQGCSALKGGEQLERIFEVDQTPIGKTPRSCPATYIGFWDQIRKLFAATGEARIHGWDAGRFSFNTKHGRCDACDGQGVKKVEMSFLPNVKMVCDACGGKRFNPETLSIHYKGKSIGDVLNMSADEAVEHFEAHPAIHHALTLLQDVGLGYITFGQQSPTLSGGEAQRIKLVTELAKAKPSLRRKPAPTLYVLDEPTVGLHMADVVKLIRVLHRLVESGHSVVVIEHNLDVIAEADWIIDMGPEGGAAGGEVVAEGRPEKIARATKRSQTGKALAEFLSGQ
ncbi:excinuclease ABC subunit UvrA [Solemya velesiana gill symbiont]|uniref:UvrABC system protein A n=1 Tax=Solemya velesiana gill symbiont TaxID=1918948 RepID=A0A1T2KY57_9GAMM|nr:excinuclease ABC subunit UvrA [Solemya velesiana gill symbiont]OOZ37656.1 excinuclease ABC subunit A [Solemya velesiana gill symbiont]